MSKFKRFAFILRGVLISYIITVLLIMVYSFLLEYTDIPESTIPTIIFVISMISVFIGSSISMIRIREDGLINGGIVGLIHVLVLYLLSSVFITGFGLNGYSFWMILACIFMGIIGGIVGVNFIRE